jgi:ectoine hydroxylase
MNDQPNGLSSEQIDDFRRDGYLILRGLFATDEIQRLADYSRSDPRIDAQSFDRLDAAGRKTRLVLFNYESDDLYSMFSRSERLVRRAEQLLEGEVYHWHTKLTLKEPHDGGAWEWHQDYGYWYNNGCLEPLLVSCLIPIDPATVENGCLQVLRGSQRLGRVDHLSTGDQTGADPARVAVAQERFELVPFEAEPGDAIFFDCNLLHRSDENLSPNPRWTVITCFNARRNDPYCESRHPAYHPLKTVSADAIREWVPPAAAT